MDNFDDYYASRGDYDYGGEDGFDFDDYDGDLSSNYSVSVLSSEVPLFPKPEYSETTELRFHSYAQSPCRAFFKYSFTFLTWCGFDKNKKIVYGVLFWRACLCDFQIVKYCPTTSGFYIVKRYDDGNEHKLLGCERRLLGFDESNGTFFIIKLGTVPSIILYNATSDFETYYRFKDGIGFLPAGVNAVPCIDRQEWILFTLSGYFQRVIFDEDEKCVSVSEYINFPDHYMTSVEEQVFIHDKDTVIFVKNWNKILVYNLENCQFNVEEFSIDGLTEDRPRRYSLRRLNVTGVRDFYVSSHRYGVLKMDFPAKKWRSVRFSVCVDVSIGDLFNLVNRGDFVQHFAINDPDCSLIGEPINGCFCALFTKISTKPDADKKRDKNGKKQKNKYGTEDKFVQIVCCRSSALLVSLQDLCLSKLFGEFRKNKGAEKITDIEFCHQIGISPDLIQKYIGFSGV